VTAMTVRVCSAAVGRCAHLHCSLGFADDSHIPRVDGCGPPGAAKACTYGYLFNMSLNLEIRRQLMPNSHCQPDESTVLSVSCRAV